MIRPRARYLVEGGWDERRAKIFSIYLSIVEGEIFRKGDSIINLIHFLSHFVSYIPADVF